MLETESMGGFLNEEHYKKRECLGRTPKRQTGKRGQMFKKLEGKKEEQHKATQK